MKEKKNATLNIGKRFPTKRNRNATQPTVRNANHPTIMVKSVKRSQNKNVHTKMYQNIIRFQRKNVLKRPFQNVTMFLKSTATLIPYQNATRFHNNTAQRNTRKNVPSTQSKFQLKSKKAFVCGPIRDTAMMTIIAKSKIYISFFTKATSFAFGIHSFLSYIAYKNMLFNGFVV